MALRPEDMRIGMMVKHPQSGVGVVRSIGENVAEIRFDEGTRRISPQTSELELAEKLPAVATEEGSEEGSEEAIPMDQVIRDTVDEVLSQLNLDVDSRVFDGLAARWKGGKIVFHSPDLSLQTKEIEIETFFHKIVMMRNNLRMLEAKVNGHSGLSDGDKFELQQYITRCYGSMTTFNVLFGNKDDQFSSKG
jgi:hypothetical protein